jgi:hypothetical protein
MEPGWPQQSSLGRTAAAHHSLGHGRRRKWCLAYVCNALGQAGRLDADPPVSTLVSLAVPSELYDNEGFGCGAPAVRIIHRERSDDEGTALPEWLDPVRSNDVLPALPRGISLQNSTA